MNGYTDEEAFLNRLGRKSFLQFWSWSNLFRDQGHVRQNGDGKEICDLIVIFGNDILLFSDKKVNFNSSHNLKTAWARWVRKAIGNSIKQIKGARRWLHKFPNRVFLDKKCKERLPINLPNSQDIRFHNIVVCHGIEEQLMKVNDEPSFVFDNRILDEQHWSGNNIRPFKIGRFIDGGFIHVFNEATIELILKEFDTVKDFIAYLIERESLLNYQNPIEIKSESDIVQLYYENFDDKSNKYSILNAKELEVVSPLIDKGGIDRLYSNSSFILKKEAEKVSAFWDKLIENHSFHILNNSSHKEGWDKPSEIEPYLRKLAETNRFQRRLLSESFIDFYQEVLPGERGTRLFRDPYVQNQTYLFFFLPYSFSNNSNENYRNIRKKMLRAYCCINKYLKPDLELILGIAAKTRDSDKPFSQDDFFNEGQDFIYYDFAKWTQVEGEESRRIYEKYLKNGLISKRRGFTQTSDEFPQELKTFSKSKREINPKNYSRNRPCFCGSGKKAKKCCGRL